MKEAFLDKTFTSIMFVKVVLLIKVIFTHIDPPTLNHLLHKLKCFIHFCHEFTKTLTQNLFNLISYFMFVIFPLILTKSCVYLLKRALAASAVRSRAPDQTRPVVD